MTADGDRVRLAFLDEELVVRCPPGQQAALHAVLRDALLLPSAFRAEVEAALWDFYVREIQDGSADFDTAQHQIDWEQERHGPFPGAAAATRPGEVWPLVRFRTLAPSTSRTGRPVLRVDGDAAWDGEHGVVLHLVDGRMLARVSGHGSSV